MATCHIVDDTIAAAPNDLALMPQAAVCDLPATTATGASMSVNTADGITKTKKSKQNQSKPRKEQLEKVLD